MNLRSLGRTGHRLRKYFASLTALSLWILVLINTSSAQDVAPLGTPYRWSQNSSPTSNGHRSSASGLNVIGNANDIALDPNGGDSLDAYEAGGVIWSSPRQLKSIAFVNGSWSSSTTDGVFCANLSLQTTTDGVTWTVSNWTVSPSYSYDSSGASLQTYTFSGTEAITVLGIRISGQVHCADSGSWIENMREIVANGPGPQTIWTPSTVPATPDVNDYTGAVNLGVRFQSASAGTISGIRFYKTTTNTGTHTATLYDNTGTVLAQATFSNETGSGWQEVDFPPVNIAANTTYVAAYHTTNGHYSVNSSYFNSSFSNGQQLTALANGTDGSNGVYLYGDSVAFPTQTYNENNYWVDVVFNIPGGIPPWAASNLQGQAISSERAKLTWTASPDDPTGVGYYVYRNAVLAGTTSGTSYIDIGLSSNTAYAYSVVAFNGYGQSATTSSTSVTTPNNYMPANLVNFFPVGPDSQPTSLLSAWAARGANALIRTPQGLSTTDWTTWNTTADSLGFKYIRDPDPTTPANDIGKPNLLAWHQADEPETSSPVISASAIVNQYNSWKQVDPTRAVSLNFNGGSLIDQQGGYCDLTCYASYLQGADWAMSDIYPVSGWNQPNSLAWVGQSVDTLYSLAPNKPIMQFIEVAYQNLPWCGQSCQAPTPEQFRGEFWDAIIHGARGVFIFPEQPYNPFIFDNTTPSMDAEITTQFNTAKTLGSVLQGTINPIGMAATVSSPLEVSWRNYNGHQYIFVLNASYNAKSGQTIVLTGIGSATQATVYGESRTVPISSGVITDDFGPHAIHIYQIN